MSERQKHKAQWRMVDGGIQLRTGLWWVAFVGPSEQQLGKYYYKVVLCEDPVVIGYEDKMEDAIQGAVIAAMRDRFNEYTILNHNEARAKLSFYKHNTIQPDYDYSI